MKLISAAVALTLIAASPEVRFFRYERPVQLPAQSSGQACFVVDPEVFAHASLYLNDLRLYGNGAETPFVVRMATAVEGSEKVVPLLNAGVSNGQTVFDAELPNTHYSDLQLAVRTQNFIATVTVWGSRTKAGTPATRLGDFTIFDLTRQRLGRSTMLHLPTSSFPILHFRIAGPLKPEDVTGLSVGRLPATQPRYRTVAETDQAAQKDHATVLKFIVPAHVPVDRVVFTPGVVPAAFSRDVSVSVQPVTEKRASEEKLPPPTIAATGSLLRVHKVQEGKRIDEERLALETPRESFDTPSQWTVTVSNGDDVPLSLKSVRLEMLERTLCFDAAAGASYVLRYGDAALAAPQYDYARLFSPQPSALRATAAAEQLNPAWQPRPDERPFTEKHPILLWVALILVIALLAAIAFRSSQRASHAP